MQINTVTITTGEIGMRHQAQGLAACLSDNYQEHIVTPPVGLRRLPATWVPKRLLALPDIGDRNLLITCGRRSVAYSLALKRLQPELFTVHIQNPQVSLRHFDLVVPMAHDNCFGPNVMSTTTAIHHLQRADLLAAAQPFRQRLKEMPEKKIVFMLGGNTKDYRFTDAVLDELLEAMAQCKQQGFAVLLTTARRTPEAIVARLKQQSGHYHWGYFGEGENPYLCFLDQAAGFIMTSDSVSMISEAMFTGKPLYLIDLPGFNRRLAAFKQSLVDAGFVRSWQGEFVDYAYQAPDAKLEVAAEILRRMSVSAANS